MPSPSSRCDTSCPPTAVGRLDVSALKEIAISESGFVFDPRSGQTFNMNRTALAALRALKDGVSLPEAAKRLGEDYACDNADDPLGDLQDFVGQLAAFGLVTRTAEG